jgi:hypothetical protein
VAAGSLDTVVDLLVVMVVSEAVAVVLALMEQHLPVQVEAVL